MTRACPDPSMSDSEWEAFKEDERYESPEPPRLSDPPTPGKTCGGCEHVEFLPGELLYGVCREHEQEVCRYDEACEAWEGSE